MVTVMAAERTVGGRESLRRLHAHGLRPNHELGQNFLVDDNVLGVIERAAELDPGADVVLEVGGGLGALSEHLAPRVRHLHVVEVDRSLAPALEEAVEPYPNVDIHYADAVRLDLAALSPRPGKVVANLPYGVAATVLLRTVLELPAVHLWVAMVQREVAERLAAAPGSRVYGATSAIAQLGCEVKLLRKLAPSVFHPRPRVESALVRLRRTGPPPDRGTVALVHAAFAHRRKALAGSLALAAGAEPGLRERAREELERIGHPADARAERLAPSDFAALAVALGDCVPEVRRRG
jgi:16S rRNA (adenine1518-N6/adenine1519-N6)-dimethyltransferase